MSSALLSSGTFLAMRSRSLLQFSALKILPVRLPDQSGPVGIVTMKNRTLSSTARLFIDCVREVVKPLAKGGRSSPAEKVVTRGRPANGVRLGSCVTSIAGPHGDAQLFER
jgi:hypothetical protein